jgi:nucleotide-binding universal stress UspA family protein
MYQRILLPTDGSDISRKAAASAIQMAQLCRAQLRVLSVAQPFPYSAVTELQPLPPVEYDQAQERLAQERVDQVLSLAKAQGVEAVGAVVSAMQPWEAILEHARETQCDLLVMASHGRRGMAALLLGSETSRVLTHTELPVLVVR